jgi:radical SAM superfamily enzyme YgiQ (UPF0313 family)
LGQALAAIPGTLALYDSEPGFLGRLLAAVPELAARLSLILRDPAAGTGSPPGGPPGVPVIAPETMAPGTIETVFLCETGTEKRWRLRRRLEGRVGQVLCPDLTPSLAATLPLLSFIRQQRCIYPLEVPEIRIEPGLDVLLLDLPGRNNFAPPLGLAYVHKALNRTEGLRCQTFDADLVLYHRFHIKRIFDLGEDQIILDTGRPLATDPWQWNEDCWLDTRLWPDLYRIFSADLDELVAAIVAARPAVLALSVHQRNEWSTRAVARRVKAALPETMILAGGHSCLFAEFAAKVFPEHDYIVVGEAEMVVGDLVRRLARGERPADLPGILSRFDRPGRVVGTVPVPHDMDAIGAPAYDWVPDFMRLYRDYQGTSSFYVNLTRGCIWSRCTFCGERFRFRQRSAKNFVDEIEHYAGFGIDTFSFGDSDFGGQTEVLRAVAEEILSRGLKVTLKGQIRVNPRLDEETLRLIHAAGIGANFGVDALTRNTLKLQRKGYSLETLKSHLAKCAAVGLPVSINLMVGMPGETEQDIDDTIQFIADNRHMIRDVFNISAFFLMQGSVYWEEPEKHGIVFYGDKAKIYEKHFYGVPDDLWCSVNPYIDSEIRTTRCLKILNGLYGIGIPVNQWGVHTVNKRFLSRSSNIRDIAALMSGVEGEAGAGTASSPWQPSLTNHAAGHALFALHDGVVRISAEDGLRLSAPLSLVSVSPRA